MNQGMILDALNKGHRCLKEPSAALHQAYDRRYLTSLRVYGPREDYDEPQSPQTLGQNIIDPQVLKKKITAAFSLISFRDPHVLVQFWSPLTVRKRCLLTTLDQPFGISVVNETLYKYRLESEQRMFAVDGEHIEELGGSPGRVYRQKLPEWSLDAKGLPTSQNIKDSTACHNIHGYIRLPVVDSASGCCVGVLELLTLSKHSDYAFEVIEISKALKEQDLKTSNVFEEPSFCELPSEDREIQGRKILDILKVMCDTHNLPLAQTWELSPLSSHVSHEKSIQKSCSSFNSRCIGKVCMSTAGLPFYVRDLSMWEFHKVCMEQHLEKSRGVVGRALLSHCASYCENVTKLSEEEYPLVRNACTSGLGGCFAIFLHGVEGKNDYVLEFFMPLDIKDSIDSYVLNLVQKLKLKIQEASGFEMGDISSIEVIRPPSVVNNVSSMTEVDTPNGIIPHPFVTNVTTIACGAYANVSLQKTRDKGNDAGEPSNRLIRNIKRKRDSLTMEAVKKQFGQPMDEACKSLGVSRSTLKRFLRDHSIPRWPSSKLSDRSVCITVSNQRIEGSCPIWATLRFKAQSMLSCWFSTRESKITFIKFATMHQDDYYLVFENKVVVSRIQVPNYVDPLMAGTAMMYQNYPVVFDITTYMEKATNNVEPIMDVDLDKVTDLNFVDAFPRLSGADFTDDQGSFLKMAGCSSGSIIYLKEPDGIENAMVHIEMGLEAACPSDPLQQATNNVDPLMDIDVTDYLVDEFLMLSSGSVPDDLMVPDGNENPMAEIGMGLEGAWAAWPSPISSGDMYSFGANPSDYDFSNLVFDD